MGIEINAAKRDVQGTGASRRLRRESKVPGIIYGGGKDAQSITIDHNELWHKLKLEAFHASILDMSLDGEKLQVLMRDYQMHPFKQIVNHIDFQRVAADREIHMKVPLHFKGEENSPGVKQQGGLVSHIMNELEIACLPKDLPNFIEVDLATLSAQHPVHVADIKLPAGVRATVLNKGDNPTVATVVIKGEVAEDEVSPVIAAADIATTTQKKKEDAPAAGAGKKDEKKKDDKKK